MEGREKEEGRVGGGKKRGAQEPQTKPSLCRPQRARVLGLAEGTRELRALWAFAVEKQWEGHCSAAPTIHAASAHPFPSGPALSPYPRLTGGETEPQRGARTLFISLSQWQDGDIKLGASRGLGLNPSSATYQLCDLRQIT